MINIVEFLAKKHLEYRIKIARLDSRNAYYVYLENDKDGESDDIRLFKTNVIAKLSEQYRNAIYNEFEECLYYYKTIMKNSKTESIGIRFHSPYSDSVTDDHISYTNFKNGGLINKLKFFSINVDNLIDCIENDWENIENYIK